MIPKEDKDTPGDSYISSGDSIIRGTMDKINNITNISHYLKGKSYSFLDKVQIIQEDEYPQGLCFTDEYLLLSSYSDVKGELSKIRIFDRVSGEFLISLGVDDKSHLGGIAYDGTYIWMCNSSKMSLERISYEFVQQIIDEKRGQLVDIRTYIERCFVSNIPSCITYYNGLLWVGTHSIWSNAIMTAYRYDEVHNCLDAVDSYWIPPKVQGIAFSKKGEVYLSTSYGRRNPSYIWKYDSICIMSKKLRGYSKRIKLPPCSEGIVYADKKLYVLFESAGKKYLYGTDGKGKSIAPIDKILILFE